MAKIEIATGYALAMTCRVKGRGEEGGVITAPYCYEILRVAQDDRNRKD
jgi:hypothetical protein